jgi:hypothetical protein
VTRVKGWQTLLAVVAVALAGLVGWWLWPRERHATDVAGPQSAAEPAPRPAAPERRPISTTATSRESTTDAGLDIGSAESPIEMRRIGRPLPLPDAPAQEGAACDDGDPCTFDDRYAAGACRGRPLQCDDDNPLTDDSCTGDGCLHAFAPGAFDRLETGTR